MCPNILLHQHNTDQTGADNMPPTAGRGRGIRGPRREGEARPLLARGGRQSPRTFQPAKRSFNRSGLCTAIAQSPAPLQPASAVLPSPPTAPATSPSGSPASIASSSPPAVYAPAPRASAPAPAASISISGSSPPPAPMASRSVTIGPGSPPGPSARPRPGAPPLGVVPPSRPTARGWVGRACDH